MPRVVYITGQDPTVLEVLARLGQIVAECCICATQAASGSMNRGGTGTIPACWSELKRLGRCAVSCNLGGSMHTSCVGVQCEDVCLIAEGEMVLQACLDLH